MKKNILFLLVGLLGHFSSLAAGTGDVGSVGMITFSVNSAPLEALLKHNPLTQGPRL